MTAVFDSSEYYVYSKKALSMTQTAPIRPMLTQSADAQARPKIMRRPAQFSNTGAQIIPHSLPLNMPNITTDMAPSTPIPQPPRAWQDDGRFAITLLALVIGINLLVSAWLSTITPEKSVALLEANTPKKPTGVVILNELNPPESNQ